ncbi:MAG: outer membrane beta-barrel protein [Sphingomonadaceae bacterium]|nr:outer membrane beta-barrel protein [Sphingomonadaceae bacterium]
MKAAWLIWIGALTAPLCAANGQGLRVEALAGYDTDGFQHGALLGARAGYDFSAAPNVLIGIDGEYNDITSRQRFAGSPLVIHYGPEIYVGGRATFLVPAISRRLRLFAAAGYSRSHFGNYFLLDPSNLLGPVGAERRTANGYRLSGGAQFSVGRRAFLGAEYRYSNYADPFDLDRAQYVGSIGFRF